MNREIRDSLAQVPVWRLPKITDPLGKHWNQPAGLRDRVGLYFNHATISEDDWGKLSRYESSIPSGVYAGKVWRRGNLLCWFGRDLGFREHTIGRLRALIQGPGTNVSYREHGPALLAVVEGSNE